MKLTSVPTGEHLQVEVQRLKAYVTSAEAVEAQIDHLESVIAICRANSGFQSPGANNLTASLLQQLRFSTAAMFLTNEELIGKPCAEGYPIPRII